jgi:hypothetical protein
MDRESLLANSALDLIFPFPLGWAVALVAALSALVTTAGLSFSCFCSSISLKSELSSLFFFLTLDSPTFLLLTYFNGVGSLSESSSAIVRFLLLALAFGGGWISSESESIILRALWAGLRLINPMSSSSLESYFISISSGIYLRGD